MERKLIAAAVSSALALPMAAQAVEFSVSGQVNRAIISVDDGGENDGSLQHVDADSSETRFRFTGSEELDSGMTAGVQLELGRPSDWRTRHANVYLTTAGGKLTIGQASAATDGMAHADLGGPSWLGGATNWCSYVSSGPACPSNDGGRAGVLRYDTPALGPASIAVSAGNNEYWDVMLKIAGSFGDAGYDLRVGYIAEYDTPADEVAESNETITGVQWMGRLEDAGFEFNKDKNSVVSGPAGVKLPKVIEPDNALTGYETLHMKEDGKNGKTVVKVSEGSPYGERTTYNVNTAETPAGTESAGDIFTASAAVNFGQGTSVAVAWSKDDTEDHEYKYVKLDHSYGDGSIGVYYKTGDQDEVGDSSLMWDEDEGVYAVTPGAKTNTEGSLWGIGVGHNIGGGATAYAGYRQISEDGEEDVDLIVAGMRVTFN